MKITELWHEEDFETDLAIKQMVAAVQEAEAKAKETVRQAELAARKAQTACMRRPPGLGEALPEVGKEALPRTSVANPMLTTEAGAQHGERAAVPAPMSFFGPSWSEKTAPAEAPLGSVFGQSIVGRLASGQMPWRGGLGGSLLLNGGQFPQGGPSGAKVRGSGLVRGISTAARRRPRTRRRGSWHARRSSKPR